MSFSYPSIPWTSGEAHSPGPAYMVVSTDGEKKKKKEEYPLVQIQQNPFFFFEKCLILFYVNGCSICGGQKKASEPLQLG